MGASTTPILHVRAGADGRWVVECDDVDRPLSEHIEATAAIRAATAHAEDHGGEVLLHDAYHCTRAAPHRFAEPRR